MAVRVLLVEDDDRVRAVLGLALEDEGYEVAQTASAEEALGSFADVDPDVMRRTGLWRVFRVERGEPSDRSDRVAVSDGAPL